MPGFADIFKGLLGGDPVKSISDLIDQFHLSPDQKAQLQQAAAELQLKRQEIESARDEALAQIQGQNIRTETSSSDAFVRRARPTFLYVMIAAVGFSLIVCPLVNAVMHRGLTPLAIPDSYLQLFGVAFLGYTGARTWEKTKGKS